MLNEEEDGFATVSKLEVYHILIHFSTLQSTNHNWDKISLYKFPNTDWVIYLRQCSGLAGILQYIIANS